MQPSSSSEPDSPSIAAAHCPQCARFVGPYERCPYCGARIRQRISIRVVKLIAVALATFGLVLLWWLARSTEIPTVAMADIVDTMNMAYVRVEGRLTRGLSYDAESGYLSFWVEDSTGEVHVVAYEDTTEALLKAGIIPALGDELSIAGTVRVRDDYAAITLNLPEHLTLTRREAIALGAGEVTVLDAGQRVAISGEVAELRTPYVGMTLITLSDATGEIVIAVDEALTALTGPLPSISVGQGIRVEGAVSLYRDQPQIVPATTADVVITAAPPAASPIAPLPRLSDLVGIALGQTVRLRGRVVLLEGLKGGVKATLDDGTAQVAVVVWDALLSELETPRALDVGAEVEVQGELQSYEGELELIPEQAEDLSILQAAPPLPWVALGTVSARNTGSTVRVRGVVDSASGFSSGVRVSLSDGTGEITVLVWSNIYAQLDPAPEEGMFVEVTGMINQYRGELELIPRTALDWQPASPEDGMP